VGSGLTGNLSHKPAISRALRLGQFHFNLVNMKLEPRAYVMTARAQSAADTTRNILLATIEEFWDSTSLDLRLQDIARKSGVTVQTILRQFESKENLILEATKFESSRVQATRDAKKVHTLEEAVHQLVEHYEEMGDRVIRMLAEEIRYPSLTEIIDVGRKVHRKWCRKVFTQTLEELAEADRKRRFSQFIAICDVQTWKILRRDSGLSAKATEIALTEMLKPLTKEK